jgi:hypothetical protein
MSIEDAIKDIEAEIEQYTELADIEQSPLGGNPVKEAQYRGYATGLRSALITIEQGLLKEAPND